MKGGTNKRTDERTNGQTDERTNESPPVFYRTLSPSGSLPKKLTYIDLHKDTENIYTFQCYIAWITLHYNLKIRIRTRIRTRAINLTIRSTSEVLAYIFSTALPSSA